MFAKLGRKHTGTLTGIVSDDKGIAVASVKHQGKNSINLQSCAFEPLEEKDSEAQIRLLKNLGLGNTPCSTLLGIGDYQLLVVDAPEVPAEELRSAVRWQIQDLIDFHVDDAILDVFDAPPGGPADTRKQMYVVVAAIRTVKQRIETLESAGINLAVIDIPELAMRNIAAHLPEDETGLVTLNFSPHQCLITVTHQTTLYLTRSIDFGYLDLQETDATPNPRIHRLALEIQRSTDFYEQHYHKAPIKAVAMLPLPNRIDGLEDLLRTTLGMTVRNISLADILESDIILDENTATTVLMALGCALRTQTPAL